MSGRDPRLGRMNVAKPDREKLARVLLQEAGRNADRDELVRVACLRWDHLKTPFVGSVVCRALEMQEERAMGRQSKNTEETRESAHRLTEDLIREASPSAVVGSRKPGPTAEMHRQVCDATGLNATYQTWRNEYFYPARKRVQVELRAGTPDNSAPKPSEANNGAASAERLVRWVGERYRQTEDAYLEARGNLERTEQERKELAATLRWVERWAADALDDEGLDNLMGAADVGFVTGPQDTS